MAEQLEDAEKESDLGGAEVRVRYLSLALAEILPSTQSSLLVYAASSKGKEPVRGILLEITDRKLFLL